MGLVAVISAKRLLDFPKLLSSGRRQISFGGYSNRSLFLSENNIAALLAAIKSGTCIRVMVVDPDSDVARLRSEEPVYGDPGKFLADVRNTIDLGRKFFLKACDLFGKE